MSPTFSLPYGANAVPHQRLYETTGETLFLRNFCTAAFVESLQPDVGLQAFSGTPEGEHQLLREIAKRPDSILTLAYTQEGVIVGQVSLAPAGGYWQGLPNTYEMAMEVSTAWRRRGIARQLLKQVFELDGLEELIIIGEGLSWHWDTTGLRLTHLAYRAMIERLCVQYGFVECPFSEGNMRLDPANIFLLRPGRRVAAATYSQFYNLLLQSEPLPFH